MEEKNLTRKLGLLSSTSIVIANMIGAGIFTTSGLLIGELNNVPVMLSLWIAGGLIALCGALAYGELGAAMPGAGGEYLFLSKLTHPILGFLSGWVSFVAGFSAPIAASAMGFSEYFFRAAPALPAIFSEKGIMDAVVLKKTLSVFVILLFTFIHYRGIKTGAAVQNFLTSLKVLLILFILVAGFTSGNGDLTHFSHHDPSQGFPGFKSVGLSLMWIMYAYSGWNASTYLGAEIRNPGKNLPRSLLTGTLSVVILYTGINILYVYSIDPDKMKGVISVGGLAMGNLFGRSAEILFSMLIAVALFSSLSAYIIIGPRVYYAMARDGLFFRSVARVHSKFGVPSNSILIQGILAIILSLSGTFEQVLTYMGFALGIFPVLTVLCVAILRKKNPGGRKMPGYPYVQIIYASAGVLMLVLAFLQRPVSSGIAILTVIAGIPAYFIFRSTLKATPS